jgi:hypothetical protein
MATPGTRRAFELVVASALAACGSRTPLTVEPIEGETVPLDAAPPVSLDAGSDRDVAACLAGSRAIGQIPVDLYFTLDRSRSMDTVDRGAMKTRWQAVASALDTFINSPLSNGIGAGIAFFPRTTTGGAPLCGTADYAFPVVPIGVLPGVAPSILKAIELQTRGSGTPTTPALDGAHVYARRQQVTQPDHTTAVVVVTDGVPRDCESTVAGTSAVAAGAVNGTPAIKTYVLGVGPNLANLNAIAQAGGTMQAYLVESSGEGALLAAFEAIRTSLLSCEYALPQVGGKLPKLDDVRVTTTLGANGASTAVDEVASAEACAGRAGWFFDTAPDAGGSPPTKILLCPASCDPLIQSTGNRLDVGINCTAR